MNHAIKNSIVIPIFDEAEGLERCIRDVVKEMDSRGETYEILAVDDGSRDNSIELLQKIQVEYPRVLRVICHLRNRGNGAALRTGMAHARGEIVVCMDADGQHRAKDIAILLDQIPPFDMVVGARTNTYQGAWYRNFANKFYNGFASWLTQFPVEDLTSGFRAMRRVALLHFLNLLPSGFSAPTTTTMTFLKAGYNVKYVPIDVQPRQHGKSKINLIRDGQRFVMIILRMITLYDPMRIFLPVTVALLLLALLSWGLGIYVAGRLTVPGSTVVLFISAVQTLLLGLVSGQSASLAVTYHGDEYLVECHPEEENLQTDEIQPIIV